MSYFRIKFLEPEDEKEKKIYEDLNAYLVALFNIRPAFMEWRASTMDQLESKTISSHDGNCNYPLLDDVETDDICKLEIHHWTPDQVKALEHTLKRVENDYSGKEISSFMKDQKAEEFKMQLKKDMHDTTKNIVNRLDDSVSEAYFEYMTRMGYLNRQSDMVWKLLAKSYYGTPNTVDFGLIFGTVDFKNCVNARTICYIYGRDTETLHQIFDAVFSYTKTKYVVMSDTEVRDLLENFRVSNDGYSIVSDFTNKAVIRVNSIFTYSSELDMITQLDPKVFTKKATIGLYGVVKKELMPETGTVFHLLATPGYTDDYFGVIWSCLPVETEIEHDYKTGFNIIISDKVEVTDFRLVDKNGFELNKNVARIESWDEVNPDACEEYRIGYCKKYLINAVATVDCFLKIVGKSTRPVDTEFDIMDEGTDPIVELVYQTGTLVPISYDDVQNLKYDYITPFVTAINIPFCKNIKKLELVPKWDECGKLSDLMKLYLVDHINMSNPKEVHKDLINYNIENIMFVQAGKKPDKKMKVVHGVGWKPESTGPHDPCITLDHQGQWFLHIDLKEPIPVKTCREIQFSLMKDAIRVASNYGNTYAPAQDIHFHLTPVKTHRTPDDKPGPHYYHYGVKVTPDHLNGEPIILSENQCDFNYIKSVTRGSVFATQYKFEIDAILRNGTDSERLSYIFYPFRNYEYTDAVKVYYKKTNNLGLPKEFTAIKNIDFGEVITSIVVDIDDIPREELKEYTFYVFIRYMLLKDTRTGACWLVEGSKVEFDMKDFI